MRGVWWRLLAPITKRVRSQFHLFGYLVRAEWLYAASLVALVVGLLPMLPTAWARQLGLVCAVAGLAISLYLLWRDTHDLVTRHSTWDFEPGAALLRQGVKISAEGLPTMVRTSRGTMLTDRDLTPELIRTSTPVEWRDVPFALTGALQDHAAALVRRSNPGRWPFNGRCVRLETDLAHDSVRSTMVLREARYFDSLCSNRLTEFRIRHAGEEWDFRGAYLFAPTSTARSKVVQPLGRSALANIIGVSTMAITTDDRVLLVLQSRNAGSSQQLRAPSGSGSLEPRDVLQRSTLTEVVVAGAERELREECSLPTHAVLDSALVGYGRWLEHGAKPEFMALTALAVSSHEVRTRPGWDSGEESVWTQSVLAVPLSLDRVHDIDPWAFHGSMADRLTDGLQDEMSTSVPLEWGFRCLAAALQADPGILKRLRREEP